MKVIGAFICLMALWLVAVLAVAIFPIAVWLHPNRKEYARCIDQMVNAFLFMGEGRESVSSHCWRIQFKPIIWLTDNFIEEGHCKEANRHEQPVVDVING